MQDEGNSCVSGRRKRRPTSELIHAYQCTVCGKKYASGLALSLHKKNTHKQPAVPDDEHDDVTKADNSSVDEGSQGQPKRRRRLKSEADGGHFPDRCVARSMAAQPHSILTTRPAMVHDKMNHIVKCMLLI